MAGILIISTPNDSHALAVELSLRRLGCPVHVWVQADMPDYATSSIAFDPASGKMTIDGTHDGEKVCLSDFSVTWNRRRVRPKAPEGASEYDVHTIETETDRHCDNIVFLLASSSRIVNCPIRQRYANRKAVQLKYAAEAGFNLLPTLFSNDFEAIERFYRAHHPIVAKPHLQHAWTNGDSTFNEFTFEMPPPETWERESLEHCPLIFQRKVARRMEVRAIVFGGRAFAARIANERGALDARMASMLSAFEDIEAIELPAEIRSKCEAYLASMSMDYGAFDLIVDQGGTWYFLECNEGGQFLYLEEFLPDMNLLEEFALWLIELSGFELQGDRPRISYAELTELKEAEALVLSRRSHKCATNNVITHEHAEPSL